MEVRKIATKNKKRSTRDLIGVDSITDYSIRTPAGELVFFVIAPTNINVLPHDSIEARINALLNVIRSNDGIELMATDSMESFVYNKQFYRARLEKEALPAIRRLLQLDMEHLDRIQIMTASSREFFLILPVNNNYKGEIYSLLSSVEKAIHDQGFVVHRASKHEMRKLLAVYYEQNMTADRFYSYDGQQWTGGTGHGKA